MGAEVLLTWPDWAGYLLESSTNPPDAGNWVPVTNTPVLIGGQNLLTNPATEPFLFYRLRKPLR